MNEGRVLVTGAAGFIGSAVSKRLLSQGTSVVGVDNLNDYYDVELKKARLQNLAHFPRFELVKFDIKEGKDVAALFARHRFEKVIHLAAQAGVRYSLTNPLAYVDSNLVAFTHILEACRHQAVPHLVYASSSSVYGANAKSPFSERDDVSHPMSLYGATKRANEMMAHSYSSLYGLPTTGLRFFSVYGPWGRPDMALFLFTRAILAGKPIDVFNYGKMQRDFTYIDDIVEGVLRISDHIPGPSATWNAQEPDPGTSYAPYRVYNIGNNRPAELLYVIELLEKALGRQAQKNLLPMQPGDVPTTCADLTRLETEIGFRPVTSIERGVAAFVDWYQSFYGSPAAARAPLQRPEETL